MYRSLGTITIEPDGDAGNVKVFFVPEHDYFIKHEEEKCAVFAGDQGYIVEPMDGVDGKAKIIILDGIRKVTLIRHMNEALDQMVIHAQVRAAATTRSKVQIWVEQHGNDLKLTNIMPA